MKESTETTKSEKVCPLFAIREKRTEERYYRRCIKDECAWYLKRETTGNYKGSTIVQVDFEGCAIIVIADKIRRS